MTENGFEASSNGTICEGGYPERTIEEIADEFRYLAGEGKARSVSAVLRIVYEQSKGRTPWVDLPALTLVFIVFTLLLAAVGLLNPHAKGLFPGILFVVAPFNVAFGLATWTSRDRRRQAAAQLKEIHRLALETLGIIVSQPQFVPKPLHKDHRKTFWKLRSVDPAGWNQIAKLLSGPMDA